jgi:predicted permease
MRLARIAVHRLRSLFRRSRADIEMQSELDLHLAQLTKEHIAAGMDAAAARRAARLEFGSVEGIKEECRNMRRVHWIYDIGQDLAYAVRLLSKSPAFTLTAVLSLALGIGANTAVFSVIDALMLRELPVRSPGQLAAFFELSPDVRRPATYATSYEWVKNYDGSKHAFSDVAGICLIDRSEVSANGVSAPARIALVTGNYFSMLGVGAAAGRTLMPEDDRVPGGHPIAVIGYAYWESHFGADRRVLGQTLTLNDVAYTIIGVAPRGFSGEWVGRPADIWIPAVQQAQAMPEFPTLLRNSGSWLRPLARLAPGVSMAAAEAAIQPVYQDHYRQSWPHPTPQQTQFMARARLLMRPAGSGISPQRDTFGQYVIILMVAGSLVLMIACANVANLLLTRSAVRQREMAVRLAIGAGRPRIVRQLLTESVLLAALGGLAGMMFSVWGTNVLASTAGSGPLTMDARLASSWVFFDLRPDWRVFAFAAGLCLIAGALFGLAPVFRFTKTPLSPALTERGSTAGGTRRLDAGKLLVVSQVAMSLLLVVGAGLFLRTLGNLRTQDLGFDRHPLLLVWTAPAQTGRQGDALANFVRSVQERLSDLPGVLSASMSNHGLLQGDEEGVGSSEFVRIPGKPPKPGMPESWVAIAPHFFETAGIRLLAGRDFNERDTQGAPKVAIVSLTSARFFFGEEDPIGKRIALRPSDVGFPYEIVGVVADAKYGTVRDKRGVEYFPYMQSPNSMRAMCIAVRTAGPPVALANRVRRELHDLDANFPVLRIDTVQEQLDAVLSNERMVAQLTGFFGGLTLLLACMGLYGVIAYAVVRRTGEIGLRMALGATRGGVLGLVLKESMLLALAGIVIGALGALGATRLIASRLFGIQATDPLTFGGAILLMVVVTALAAFLPAQRASVVDPIEALRHE